MPRRLSALSTLKLIVPCPKGKSVPCSVFAATVTPVKGVRVAGQKNALSEHVGIESSGKKKPLELLSMKLDVRLWPVLARFVMKWSFKSTVNMVAFPRVLFVSVPIPKTSDPLRVGADPESGGNCSATPLLSFVKNSAGWLTCCANWTRLGLQLLSVQE